MIIDLPSILILIFFKKKRRVIGQTWFENVGDQESSTPVKKPMLKQVQLKISPQKRVILDKNQKDQGPSAGDSEQRPGETDPENRLVLLEKCLSNDISDGCKKMSHEWSNKCVYKCKLCKPPKTISNKSTFLSHLRKVHQVWSLTQFYSVDFSQSRIGALKRLG